MEVLVLLHSHMCQTFVLFHNPYDQWKNKPPKLSWKKIISCIVVKSILKKRKSHWYLKYCTSSSMIFLNQISHTHMLIKRVMNSSFFQIEYNEHTRYTYHNYCNKESMLSQKCITFHTFQIQLAHCFFFVFAILVHYSITIWHCAKACTHWAAALFTWFLCTKAKNSNNNYLFLLFIYISISISICNICFDCFSLYCHYCCYALFWFSVCQC